MAVEHATQKELGNLLQQATRWLPPLDLAEATELLAVREYSLALEVIADGLRQTKHIEPFIDLILKLAREMEIGNQPFVKALNKR